MRVDIREVNFKNTFSILTKAKSLKSKRVVLTQYLFTKKEKLI